MVAVVESPNPVWDTPTSPGKAGRLRGVHGDVTNNQLDGFTNFAFFDGHVSRYGTAQYDINGLWKSRTNGWIEPINQETLFYLQNENMY
jgi:prepilin-type processing-associated H-X9-DG protein